MGVETDGRGDGPAAGEEQWLARLAADERKAFEEVAAAYRHRVAALAYRLLGWDGEAEDVVQDVFLAVLRNLRRFGGRSSLWTWLAAITINRCRSLRRRRLIRLRFLSRLWSRPAANDPPGGPEQAETFQRVRQAVRALPTKLREVAVLRYLEEMPVEQVAQVVGASRNVVQVRLHRARAILKHSLVGLIEDRGP